MNCPMLSETVFKVLVFGKKKEISEYQGYRGRIQYYKVRQPVKVVIIGRPDKWGTCLPGVSVRKQDPVHLDKVPLIDK